MINKKPRGYRIGIDARFYGVLNRGIGRYVQQIVEHTIKDDRKNEYVIFLGRENFHKFTCPDRRIKKVLAKARWYTITEQLVMPWLIWRERLDLVHFPHVNVPIFTPGKFVLTCHDLISIKLATTRASTLPAWLYKIKHGFYMLVIGLAVKRARQILTVSEYGKLELIKRFNIKPDNISVAYEGVADLSGGRVSQPGEILKKYNLNKPYLLYVGSAYPHKNLASLIKVFAKINFTAADKLTLALIGKDDYFYSRLKQETKNISPNAVFPGHVPDSDLKILYQEALAYVFPSLCEGFGLPALEAMAYGLPVISSDKASLPEILGQAAVYFNPENEAEMKEKIELVINDESLRRDLIKRGAEQVKKYSWNECARQTLAVYNKVLVNKK
jgi:glycosyltransferase involved in cell wall biosynthesis